MTKTIDLTTDRLGRHAEEFARELLDAHEGLTFQQSVRFDVQLALILANQIGDIDVLRAALEAARKNAV